MEENRNAYSEVIEILKLIEDEETLEKLPIEMLEVLKSKTNPEYKPVILKDVPLEEQNLQKETYNILAWISTKYLLDDEEIKQENIEDIKAEDECNKEEKIVKEEQAVDNKKESNYENNDNLPVLYKDMKWYQKIKIKIIEFFNRLFKKKNLNIENEDL